MSWYHKFLIWIIAPIILATLQIIWRWYWPEPINHAQIIFAGLTIWLLYSPTKTNLFWMIFLIYWLLDLVSALPFGINTISAFLSFLLLYRLSTRVFTGHSISTAFLLTAIGSVAFRIIYLLTALLWGFIDLTQIVGQNSSLMSIIWEITLTAIVAVIIFLASVFGTRRFNPRYILVDNINK
ncbi:MAG: hypothetical protein A3J93_00335 [Candidatus Magasanikbacteria bacterium RIFOXYC2_FULL_42_28]|uniref:Rod shape-determining protein MreD n=1 Tax=Candidatus Magasanikbacteria bacterium RIFOXYC2_FULL_42_28 TaxID=1798704 RepID=A0A1F6NW49_9BACT|nr:MAG: hypothetical protein A3J93_00335 [Candidatus Magasanikbacteria bacterium RIFOXYC2_FULL_42_28]